MPQCFKKVYEETYKEVFEIIEKRRKETIRKALDTIISSVSIGLLIGLIIAINNNNIYFMWASIMLALLISAFLLRNTDNDYNKEYKAIVIKKILEKYYPNLQYI